MVFWGYMGDPRGKCDQPTQCLKQHGTRATEIKTVYNKKGAKKMSGSNNINWFPGPTLQMKRGIVLVTFNPGGVVQIKINKFSAREVLLFQVKKDRATIQYTMHLQSKWTSSMAWALGSYWPPLFAIRLKRLKEIKIY